MKIQVEVDGEVKGCEVIIRCAEINEEVQRLQQVIMSLAANKRQMVFYQKEKEYYFSVDQILFFETEASGMSAHTNHEVFQVKYKLYELEELLPSYFMRVSKSTILNTREVYSVTKSLTASSMVEFKNTHKTVYVSRNYYKSLKYKLDQR